MNKQNIPEDILRIIKGIKSKRPRTVIEHIIEHGHITTEELKEIYGYNHPPRAARDVREHGIPLETFKVKDSNGRSIAAYRFGKWKDLRFGILKGRKTFPKQFKKDIIAKYGNKCRICSGIFDARYLQIDHRVPFEIAGDEILDATSFEKYMILCSSCNREKSWSCEHCNNWNNSRDQKICATCYWANPENCSHVATHDIRRLDIVWKDSEVSEYDKIEKRANEIKETMPDFIKLLLRKNIK